MIPDNQAKHRRPRVMICEDEPLLALDLTAAVEATGAVVVGPFASHREAMEALQKEAPEAAILDIELTDGASTGLARALRLADVPFVVVSGITISAPPPEFVGVEWIEKPADNRRLRPLLDAARARALLRSVFAPDAAQAKDSAAATTL